MWKAFDEMQQLGWIGSETSTHGRCAGGRLCSDCSSMAGGTAVCTVIPQRTNNCFGTASPRGRWRFLMIKAMQASQGTAVTVSDQELMAGVEELAQHQGIHAAPEGGAVWIAARKLLEQGWIKPSETVILFNTGAAVKYNHLLRADGLKTLNHQSPSVLDEIAP